MRKDLIGEWAIILGLIILVVFKSNGYKKSLNVELTDPTYSTI